MSAPFYQNEENKGFRIALAFTRLALRILLVVLIIMGIVYLSKRIYALGFEAFSAKPVAQTEEEAKDVTIVITNKMELKDIAQLLNKAGLIKESEEAFIIQANAYGFADSVIPGPYVLNTSMTVEEMLEIMCTPPEDEEDEE